MGTEPIRDTLTGNLFLNIKRCRVDIGCCTKCTKYVFYTACVSGPLEDGGAQ